jgi:hypothetical protein
MPFVWDFGCGSGFINPLIFLYMSAELSYLHNITRPVGPVPTEYIGVWQRRKLETPQGTDDTSLVFWLQTERLHGDIRLHADRPAFEEPSLQRMTEQQRSWLTLQQGFAGVTAVEDDVCQWHRDIDYQPANGIRDIGRMRFEGRDRLIETGIDTEYLEVWEKLPDSVERTASVKTTVKLPDDREVSAYGLMAGSCFMFIRDRNAPLPPAPDLQTALRQHQPDLVTLAAWLDLEISFGRVQADGTGLIQHSTLPFREGRRVNLPF